MKLIYCPQCGTKLVVKKENNRSRFFCPSCGIFVYENPVPVVAGVTFDSRGRILLIRRGIEPAKGLWALPSGFMEMDESPAVSIVREMKEETGLECDVENLIGVYHQKGWRYKSIIVLGYHLKTVGGKIVAGDDAVDVRYFAYDDLPEIPFTSHRHIIEDICYRKNERRDKKN